MHRVLLMIALATGPALWAQDAASGEKGAISFMRDIAPIFIRECVQCHSEERPKGGYRLDRFSVVGEPGDSDLPPVVPGKVEESELYQRLIHEDSDERMPQKDDPLSPEEIALVARWIEQGAAYDGDDPGALLRSSIAREPHPEPPQAYAVPVPIAALAFHPDGVQLAASGYHEVTVWNAGDGKLLKRIQNLPERIQALAYNPSGTLLAVGGGAPGRMGEISLVDVEAGAVDRVLGLFEDMVLAVCFSPDGRRLAVGGTDQAIRVYDAATGREELLIRQHADWVTALAFSPDGTRLASASRDRTARVYHTATGELETTYTEHNAPLFAVAFNADATQVFSSGRGKQLHAWKASGGSKVGDFRGLRGDVTRLIVVRDHLFSGGTDRIVRLHDANDRKLGREFAAHDDWVLALAFDLTGNRLASGSHDGEVRIWSIHNDKPELQFRAMVGRSIDKP